MTKFLGFHRLLYKFVDCWFLMNSTGHGLCNGGDCSLTSLTFTLQVCCIYSPIDEFFIA